MTTREEPALREMIRSFAGGQIEVLGRMLSRMRSLREMLQGPAAEWFLRREMIGTRLLFVYDAAEPLAAQPNVWMLGFHNVIERDVELTHRAPFVYGNHEDGFLVGLDSLIRLFEFEASGGALS